MSVNVGVVDWFTKKQVCYRDPEDTSKDYLVLVGSIKQAFKETNLSAVGDAIYSTFKESPLFQKHCSDPRIPVCSLFNQSRSISAISVCLVMDSYHTDKSFVRSCLQEYSISNEELEAYNDPAEFIGLVRICALLRNCDNLVGPGGVGSKQSVSPYGMKTLLKEILSDTSVQKTIGKYHLQKIFDRLFQERMGSSSLPKLEEIIERAAQVSSSGGRYEISWSLDDDILNIRSDDTLFIHEISRPDQDSAKKYPSQIIGNHANVKYEHARVNQDPLQPLFTDHVCKCSPLLTPAASARVTGEIGYLAMDIMQIQAYVTEADKLPILRGASRIVEDILEGARQTISLHLCPETILFAGGGNLLAFIPVNPEIQTSLKAAVEKIVIDKSGKILNAAVIVGNTPLEDLSGNFCKVMSTIQKSLELAKQVPHDAEILKMRDHSMLCPACKKRSISGGSSQTKAGPELLCTPCEKKRNVGRTLPVESYLPRDIMEKNGLQFPSELQHIGDSIAVITIDGNMMGRIFQNTHTPADYTYKSETFDRRFKNVLSGTIRRFVESDLAESTLKTSQVIQMVKGADDRLTKYLGISPVYVGGDDALIIMNARGALQFCRQLISDIADEFRFEHWLMDGNPIGYPTVTLSCGIAVADMKFPIYFLLEAARRMESKAKEEFRINAASDLYSHIRIPDGSLAFTAITGAMPGEDANVFVIPAKGQPETTDSEALDRILQILRISIRGEDLEKQMISTVVTCGRSEEERLNVLKFQYAATLRKQGAAPKEWLNTCELLASVLVQERTLAACQLMVPFIWHVSEESS